jgi:hypothetical protein
MISGSKMMKSGRLADDFRKIYNFGLLHMLVAKLDFEEL